MGRRQVDRVRTEYVAMVPKFARFVWGKRPGQVRSSASGGGNQAIMAVLALRRPSAAALGRGTLGLYFAPKVLRLGRLRAGCHNGRGCAGERVPVLRDRVVKTDDG